MYIKNSQKYWEDRYINGGNSGAGSYNKLAQFKATVLNRIFKEKCIHHVIDCGCGDGNQLSMYTIAKYTGLDVSSTIIKKLKEKYHQDSSKTFHVIENDADVLWESMESADAALSIDVIFHLVEDSVYISYLDRLFHMDVKYVIIYSTNMDRYRAHHVRDRKITVLIEHKYKQWKLIETIDNIYKNVPEPHGSECSFFVYERI